MPFPIKTTAALCYLAAVLPISASNQETNAMPHSLYTQPDEQQFAEIIKKREQDWRMGPIVYQVLVDRFVPAEDLDAKKDLYAPPKQLRNWDEVPKPGKYLEQEQLWSHEIEFWGGDIQSTATKLDYLQGLGVDVLYLNPIHYGFTNHKYDSLDYKKVSPEFGTREDVKKLAQALHQKDMKLVLDGVFNHMGRNSEAFKAAQAGTGYQDWFYLGEQYPGGHRAWAGALNLPELNLENQEVRDHIYGTRDSVVQGYLLEGVDGWRLDVAFDIGFNYLQELTNAAHRVKPGSLVVGEIWNYPAEWFPEIDGIMNFTAREIILQLLDGKISPLIAGKMLDRMVGDAGIEHMLMSWLVLDNHDTPRLKTQLPEQWQQRMAQVLQMTLPGSPNIYYGVEVGMEGGHDPEMRAPMRWDWVGEDNEVFAWTKSLLELRHSRRALAIGDFRLVTAEKLLAYERYTDKVADTVITVFNPSDKTVKETIMIANSKLMNWGQLHDLLNPEREPIYLKSGLIEVELAPGESQILVPKTEAVGGYTPYKRVN